MENQNNQNNEAAKEERLPYKLEYTKFENFAPTKAEKITTTQHIARLLNERLKPAFQDYRGCFIEPAQNGGISVSLFFNQLSVDKIDKSDDAVAVAFMPIEALRTVGTNIAERNRALSNELNNGRKYRISQDAKDALGDFISANPNKINWNNISGEQFQRQGWTQDGYCYIKGIDIVRVLEIIYGSRDKDTKSRIYYNPMITAPVSNVNLARPNNWTMNIQFMTEESMKSMCEEVGYVSTGMFNCVNA